MNETKANTPEAAHALTSYIEEMLHIESRPPMVDTADTSGDSAAGCEWRIFDFSGLKACIPADVLSVSGEPAAELEVEASSAECAWLHYARVRGRGLVLIDLRQLVMPDSNPVFGPDKRPGELRIWTVGRRDLAFVVGPDVPNQVSAYEDMHRCGPDRRRQWLAGTDLETRSVFLDMDGLAAVVESADPTKFPIDEL